jgi:DNA topoisomerase-3
MNQPEANRIFGFTAKQTLDYAQSLYEKKLLTYLRTDSKYITEDMGESTPAYINIGCLTASFCILWRFCGIITTTLT